MANFVIDTLDVLKEKIDLISNLIDIKTAFQIKSRRAAKKKEVKATAEKMDIPSPIDEDYASLKCSMQPIADSHKDY